MQSTDVDVSTPWDLWALALCFARRYDCPIVIRLLRSELTENLLHGNIVNLRAFTRAAMLHDTTLAWHALINKNMHGTWRADGEVRGHNVLDVSVMPTEWQSAIPTEYLTALRIAWFNAHPTGTAWVNLGEKFIDAMRVLFRPNEAAASNSEWASGSTHGSSHSFGRSHSIITSNRVDCVDEPMVGNGSAARAQIEKADRRICEIEEVMDEKVLRLGELTINSALVSSRRPARSTSQSPRAVQLSQSQLSHRPAHPANPATGSPSAGTSRRPSHLPERPSQQTASISRLPDRPVFDTLSGHLQEDAEKRKARLRRWKEGGSVAPRHSYQAPSRQASCALSTNARHKLCSRALPSPPPTPLSPSYCFPNSLAWSSNIPCTTITPAGQLLRTTLSTDTTGTP